MKNKRAKAYIKEVFKNNKILAITAIFFCFLSEGGIVILEKSKGRLVNYAADLVKNSSSMDTIVFKKELIYFIGLLIFIPLTFWIYSKIYYKLKINSINSLRRKTFKRLLTKTYPEFIVNDEGTYLNAYTTEIFRLEFNFFNSMFRFIQIIACVLVTFPMLFKLEKIFVLAGILGVSFSVFIPALLQEKVKKAGEIVINSSEKNLALLNEILDGIETIFNFGQKKLFHRKFRNTTEKLAINKYKSEKNIAITFQLTELILNVFNAIIIILAAYFVYIGKLSIGDYVFSIGILNNLVMNVPYTSFYLQHFDLVEENLKYINRIIKELEIKKIRDKEISKVEKVEFRNVTFKYKEKEKNIIENFSHTFDKKGITEISGESGSGKSTLFNLLFNYYDPNNGEILINDEEVGEIKNLNDIITVMRQDSIFFSGTLKDNITMFQDIPDEKIINLMRELGLEKYANKKALYREEFNFSGGEERRLMFLRAILNKADILILDEPMANLDEQSIEKIEKFILKIKDRFVFVITHQPLKIPIDNEVHLI